MSRAGATERARGGPRRGTASPRGGTRRLRPPAAARRLALVGVVVLLTACGPGDAGQGSPSGAGASGAPAGATSTPPTAPATAPTSTGPGGEATVGPDASATTGAPADGGAPEGTATGEGGGDGGSAEGEPATGPGGSDADPVLASAAPAPPAAALPMYRAAVAPIGAELADRMTPTSWRPGCPVPLEDLRYVTVSHVTFEGTVATGELVVHADVADGVVQAFASLFASQYPVRSMRLVDDFGGDDTDSMDADNTSAFNCRAITGGTEWSEHAYGRAIDLNPVENPYVLGSHVAPRAGRAFAGRPDAPGVIHADDAVVEAFAAAGWQWGGYWDRPIDYQHFSVSGR